MRLSLASKTWQSSSLVTNNERKEGKYIHQLGKLLREAADDVAARWGGKYWKKRIGGYGPRHFGGVGLGMFGADDEHTIYVNYKNEVIFAVFIFEHTVTMMHDGASAGEKALVDSIFGRFGHVVHRKEPKDQWA